MLRDKARTISTLSTAGRLHSVLCVARDSMTPCVHRRRGSEAGNRSNHQNLGPVRTSDARKGVRGTERAGRQPRTKGRDCFGARDRKSGPAGVFPNAKRFRVFGPETWSGSAKEASQRSRSHRRCEARRILEDRTPGFGPPAGNEAGRRTGRVAALHKSDASERKNGQMFGGMWGLPLFRRAGRQRPRNGCPQGRCLRTRWPAKPSAPRPGWSMPPTKAESAGRPSGRSSGTAKRGDRGPAAMPAPIFVWGRG